MRLLGWVLYLLAIVITVAVVVAKYSLGTLPNMGALTNFIAADHARALLVALLLAFIAKWI